METPQDPTAESGPEPEGSLPAVPPPSPPPAPSAPPPVVAAPAAVAPPPIAPPPAQAWAAPADEVGPAPGLAYGGAGERLIAYIVDILINSLIVLLIAVVGGLIVGAGASTGSGLLAGVGAVILVIALVIVPLAYFPYFWAHDGSTPGMRVFNLKVVRDRDGGPISVGSAILRLIGYWIDWIVFGIPMTAIFRPRFSASSAIACAPRSVPSPPIVKRIPIPRRSRPSTIFPTS